MSCIALSLCAALSRSGCVERLRRALWPCPSIIDGTVRSPERINKHGTMWHPQVRGNLHKQAQINSIRGRTYRCLDFSNAPICLPAVQVNATMTAKFWAAEVHCSLSIQSRGVEDTQAAFRSEAGWQNICTTNTESACRP